MKLWLDDIRNPQDHGLQDWTWVKTASQAIRLLRTGRVTRASLDHDLGCEQIYFTLGPQDIVSAALEKTGYDVVCWLEKHPMFWPVDGVWVHSANPVGAARMRQVIEKHYSQRRSSCAANTD